MPFRGHAEERQKEVVTFTDHIVFKPTGEIDNYKLQDVEDGFGAVIALRVSWNEPEGFRSALWEKVENRLRRLSRHLGACQAKYYRLGYSSKFRSDPGVIGGNYGGNISN